MDGPGGADVVAAEEPDDSDEAEAEADLRAHLEKQAEPFRAMTESLKLGDAFSAQLKAFQDYNPLGDQLAKLEQERQAMLESLMGPASRIKSDIDALTAATKDIDFTADIRGLAAESGTPDFHERSVELAYLRPYNETLLEGVRDDLGVLTDGTRELARISGRQADLTVQLLEHERAQAAAGAKREAESAKRETRANRLAVAGWVVGVGGLIVGILTLLKQ